MPIPEHIVEFWDQRYLNGNTPWDRGEVSPALNHWLIGEESKRGRILIPGCGRGYEVIELARRGFEVVGIDAAPAAVEHLQQNLAKAGVSAKVVCADVMNWIPENQFDAVYEQTCFCAMAPSVWPDYSNRLHQWLRPRGTLHILFMQTGESGGPPFHCEITAMRSLFNSKQWQWPSKPPLRVPHPSGIYELGYALLRL